MGVPQAAYCVYEHKHRGETFYIGSGTFERSKCKSDRSREWNRRVKKYGVPEIKIIAWFDSRLKALLYEYELIRLMKPAANGAIADSTLRKAWKTYHAKSHSFENTSLLFVDSNAKIV